MAQVSQGLSEEEVSTLIGQQMAQSQGPTIEEIRSEMMSMIPEGPDLSFLEQQIADVRSEIPEAQDLSSLEQQIADVRSEIPEAQDLGSLEKQIADVMSRVQAIEGAAAGPNYGVDMANIPVNNTGQPGAAPFGGPDSRPAGVTLQTASPSQTIYDGPALSSTNVPPPPTLSFNPLPKETEQQFISETYFG